MPRNGKKKAPKVDSGPSGGKSNGRPQSKQRTHQSFRLLIASTENKFSMMDEARYTERGYGGKSSNQRLEKRTMAFISASPARDRSTEEASLQDQSLPNISRASSTSSISSEEIILFAGRSKSHHHTSRIPDPVIQLNKSTSQLQLGATGRADLSQSDNMPATAPRRTFSSGRPLAISDDEVDDGLLADYIANMDSSTEDNELTVKCETRVPDKGKKPAKTPEKDPITGLNPIYKIIGQRIAEAKRINSSQQTIEKISEPIIYNTIEAHTNRVPLRESFTQVGSSKNNLKNMTGEFDSTARSVTSILCQRKVDAGLLYLAVYDNQDDETAEWVESNQLTNMNSTALEFFQSPMWESEDSESVDSEIQAERDLADMFNDEFYEEQQLRRKQTSMTDEEIARRLAKQEEFGIEASEVVMFDGGESPGEPIQHLRKEAIRYSLRSGNLMVRTDSDDSDFDFMDHERPSLQKTKKKKGKKPDFGVLDSEMEQDMPATWENDRAKKKKRKEDREKLRAQGLLGGGSGGGAQAKYPNGMSLNELREELRGFLASDRTTLTLPPMDKTERKLVHEIAHNFSVTSTSRGNGQTRHPTLIKKLRTRPFNDKTFDNITDRLLRRFRLVGPAVRGSPGKKGFTYKEGDVVGSNAPELASDNRGRAMLEKMGWNKGDALGAVHNPGILAPITHVVKSTRSGLG